MAFKKYAVEVQKHKSGWTEKKTQGEYDGIDEGKFSKWSIKRR